MLGWAANAAESAALTRDSRRDTMALFKTRPDVRLLLDVPPVIGEVCEFTVELRCPKPVPVDAITLTLYGDVVWVYTSQHGRSRTTSRFVEQAAALLTSPRELPAGTHRFRGRGRLPANLPETWLGDRLAVEYGARVHVDIPWWPDVRIDFALLVSGPGTQVPEPGPRVYVTDANGPPRVDPYLEVSLGEHVVVPKQAVRASVALGNTATNRYREILVDIMAEESFPSGMGDSYVHHHSVARWTLPVPPGVGELQPIPFKLQLPPNLAPSFSIHRCSLTWYMRVRAQVVWGQNPAVRVPISVQTTPRTSEARGQPVPLAVGSDRLRLIWNAVAHATSLTFTGGLLHGAVGDCHVEIRRSREADAQVVGTVDFPPLGIELAGASERRSLLGGGRRVVWTARDEGQRAHVQAGLDPVVETAHTRGREYQLVDANDACLRFAMTGSGLRLDRVQEFAQFLLAVAEAVESLRPGLGAPAVVAEYVDDWRDAAAATHGQLRLADLSLTIERDELRVVVACEFDDADEGGGLRATRMELYPATSIPGRCQLLWTGDTALPEHEWPLDSVIEPPDWAESTRVALQIESDCVRLFLPAPLEDPRADLDRIEALFALGRRIRGEQGPYR